MAKWIRKPAPYDYDKSHHENLMRDRGAIECPSCKHTVEMGTTDVDCDNCGQLFNASGQALVPQSQWEEPYDEY